MPAYYAIFTTLGLQRLAEAQASYEPLVFTHLAVGDGDTGAGAAPITPSAGMTELVNERARVAVNSIEIHPELPTTVRVEGLIPAAVGGFEINESGIFNGDGELIAVASYPPIYKPTPADGVSVDEYIRILLVYEQVEAIALTIDPNVIMATRVYVDERDDFWNSAKIGKWHETLQFLAAPITTDKTPVDDYGLASVIQNGSGAVQPAEAASGSPGRYARLVNSANLDFVFYGSRTAMVPFASIPDTIVACAEFWANFQGTNNVQTLFGFIDSLDPLVAADGAALQLISGVYYLDGEELSESPDTGTWNLFRLMIFGADTPQGIANGSAYKVLYMNGAEVARLNAIPSANCHFTAGAIASGLSPSEAWLSTHNVWWYEHSQPVAMPPLVDAHHESGYSAITEGTGDGSEYLDITFDVPFSAATGADAYLVSVEISLTTSTDPVPAWAIVNKTTTGCRIQFSGDFNGEVRWKAYK